MYTDQICVYNVGENERIPAFVVEYKAPHKLTLANIHAGLHDMDPLNDVVRRTRIPHKEEAAELFKYHSEYLVAAVIAQIYSYLVESGLKYGYICTGEAFIFLHVPDNPETVYYHLSVPRVDVGETTGWLPDSDQPNRLHLTAIGQVLAFCLRAVQSRPRNQSWLTAATQNVETWVVDYDEVLKGIPETERKEPPLSEYRPPQRLTPPPIKWSPRFLRSHAPRRTVSGCEPHADDTNQPGRDSSEEPSDGDDHQNPAETPSRGPNPRRASERSAKPVQRGDPPRGGGSRMYCTQRCLLGLSRRGRLDETCPNLQSHHGDGGHHRLDPESFLHLARDQLAGDMDTNCDPLWIQGSRGALFKITLTGYGYTVAAKGTVFAWVSDLEHEASVYRRLARIQGFHVPVYLGSIDLQTPYLHGRGVQIIHMMFMAWGGDRIDRHLRGSKKSLIVEQAIRSMDSIHQHGVLHTDALPRNMLWSEELQHVLFVDFERAEVQVVEERPALSPISPNRKRKWMMEGVVVGRDAYERSFGMLDVVKRQGKLVTKTNGVYEQELQLLRRVLARASSKQSSPDAGHAI